MAAGRYTSRVFVCGEALHTALVAAAWPPHPVTGRTPIPEFSDEDPTLNNETVAVLLNEDATAQSDWKRLSPPGRDEIITYTVRARTIVPNAKTSAEVVNRLEALSAVIEGITYNTITEAVVPLGVDGEVVAGLTDGVTFQVGPATDGWVGVVDVSFRFQAQI